MPRPQPYDAPRVPLLRQPKYPIALQLSPTQASITCGADSWGIGTGLLHRVTFRLSCLVASTMSLVVALACTYTSCATHETFAAGNPAVHRRKNTPLVYQPNAVALVSFRGSPGYLAVLLRCGSS